MEIYCSMYVDERRGGGGKSSNAFHQFGLVGIIYKYKSFGFNLPFQIVIYHRFSSSVKFQCSDIPGVVLAEEKQCIR